MTMSHAVQIIDEPASISLRLSRRAEAALSQLAEPLHVELELLFSCLIRKRVLFHENTPRDVIPLQCGHARVAAHFRPAVTKACRAADVKGEQDKDSLVLHRPEAFVPRWLELDFSGGTWSGSFGW